MFGLKRPGTASRNGAKVDMAKKAHEATKPARERPRKKQQHATLTGYATVQDTTLVTDAMAAWLGAMGLPEVRSMPGGGGGAVITAGRLVIEGCGGGAGDVGAVDGGELSYGGGYGAFDMGFVIAQGRFWRVYPLVGVGGMGGGANRSGDESGDLNVGWGAALFRGGIGIDLILRVWRVGLLVGLRFGYQSGSFHVQGGDGPAMDTPEGPFFRLVVGPHVVR